jgi:hypothetical protein
MHPGAAGWGVVKVLHDGVTAGPKDGFTATINPPHDVGWAPVLTAHLEHLAVTTQIATVAPSNDDAIADVRIHRSLLFHPHCVDPGPSVARAEGHSQNGKLS